MLDRPRDPEAGVVHERVDGPCARHRVGHRRVVVDVETQLLGHVEVVQRLGAPGGGEHLVAPLRQLDGGGATEPGRATGDEDPCHGFSLSFVKAAAAASSSS